jgi:membrane protease YdiL (CAAX protease family)
MVDTMSTDSNSRPLLRILHFMPIRMGLLYVLLSYLYLSGFFFRGTMAHGPWSSLAASLLTCAIMVAAYAGVVYFVERRPATELALTGQGGREFLSGAMLGSVLYAACVLVLVALGYGRIEYTGAWHVVLPGLALAIGTGFYEELWFRGGVFRLTEEWFGSWIAIIVSSLVFGFVHLSTEGATVMDVTYISIEAGLLLAAAYMLTRRLWLSIGFHAAWNFTQSSVFSGAVSGTAQPTELIETTMTGPDFVTGGSFGMEASIVTLVLMTTVGIVMLAMAVRRGEVRPPRWRRRA